MAQRKDMRREDLIVPYKEPEQKEKSDMSTSMSSTLPMAAIFTRNKMIGWTSVMVAVQSWLSETPGQKSDSGTPAIFSVGMAVLAVGVAYMPLFMPPTPQRQGQGSGTGMPNPVPS